MRPLRTLVLGPADHFPNSLFVACPVYYHQLLCKTFGDPAVFQPCRNGTARIIQHLRQDFESRHPELQVYHWAFQWNKGLPTARILPKGSKQFSKARPIIAYTRCWHTKASSFLATALYSIMQILFPSGSTLNVNSVMHALQLAWRHLQNMDPDDEEQTGPYWLPQFCSTFSHFLSLAVDDKQVAGAFWSTNRRLDLSGGSQNRYQRTENLQRTAQISRSQHQGATNSTRHGTDRVLAAVCIFQSRA